MKHKRALMFSIVFSLVFALFSGGVYAEETKETPVPMDDQTTVEEVETFTQKFLMDGYETLKPIPFKELVSKYLSEKNELFNKEMFIRNHMALTILENFEKQGVYVTDYHQTIHSISTDVVDQKYYVHVQLEDAWSTTPFKNQSADPEKSSIGDTYDVVVTVEEDGGRLVISDLHAAFDGISARLNKEYVDDVPERTRKAEEGLSAVDPQDIPYLNPNQADGITKVDSEALNGGEPSFLKASEPLRLPESEAELRQRQDENLNQILKELTKETTIDLNDSDEDQANSLRSLGVYSLDGNRSGSWAGIDELPRLSEYANSTNVPLIHLDSARLYGCARLGAPAVFQH